MAPYELVRKYYDFPFELYEFQQEVVNSLATAPSAGYYMDPGCVDSATEYLTPAGWKKIADYTVGDRVAQWHETGQIEFVEPLEFIKKPCESMLRFKSTYGIDMLLSPEHRVPFLARPSFSKLKVRSAEEVANEHWRLKQGFKGKFITTFTPPDQVGMPFSDAQLRVLVAVIADGHFSSSTRRCVVRLKKFRKQDRLYDLLQAAAIPFDVRGCGGAEGFLVFKFEAPLRTKEFGPEFYSCSRQQLAVIAEEVVHWDGSMANDRVSFSTTSRKSADFVQYAWSATGNRAVVSSYKERDGRSAEYQVQATVKKTPNVSLGGGNAPKDSVRWEPSTDGFKYCFTVPTSFLLLRRNGRIFVTGNTGKTATSTHSALYKALVTDVEHILVVMPPILIKTWARWLAKVRYKDNGEPLSTLMYRGTTKSRHKHQLQNYDVVLMSIGIFKKDYKRLQTIYADRRYVVIIDEATSVSGISSQQHELMYEFVQGQDAMLLTGTPLNTPAQAYAYCKFTAPGIYRNLHHFENVHVAERDFFDRITAWRNLDLLRDNMAVNSVRILKEDVLTNLPAPIYTPIHYELEPKHMALYRELVEEQLLVFKDGSKLDASSVQRLYHNLQQIVMNWDYFAQDDSLVSNGFRLLEETMEEIGDKGKLVVCANYRLTNRRLVPRLKAYGGAAVFGDISAKEQERAIDRFLGTDSCRVLQLQPTSGGYGVDGLQEVCNNVLFLELPITPKDFTQAVARIYREGQRLATNVRIGVAERTLQERRLEALLASDSLVSQVVPNYQELREAFGL